MEDYIEEPYIPAFDQFNFCTTVRMQTGLCHGACVAACDDHIPENGTEIDADEFELFTELYVEAVMVE